MSCLLFDYLPLEISDKGEKLFESSNVFEALRVSVVAIVICCLCLTKNLSKEMIFGRYGIGAKLATSSAVLNTESKSILSTKSANG